MRGRGEGSIRQRRRADGSVYWEARVSIAGRQVSFYHPTKTGALAKGRQARADYERGIMVQLPTVTVGAYLEAWLEEVATTIRASSLASYRRAVTRHVTPALGTVRLARLTPGQVTSMLGAMMEAGYSESMVRHVRGILAAALSAAERDIGLQRNAARLARVPKTARPAFEPERLTPDAVRAVLTAVAGDRVEPHVLFSVATGVRQGELLGLHYEDISEGAVTIRHSVERGGGQSVLTRPKSAAGTRTLALGAMARHALELERRYQDHERELAGAAWQERGLVFAGSTGGFRSTAMIGKHLRVCVAKAGLPPIRWHALRRCFAALMLDQGVPLHRIRDLLGHAHVQVTEHYAYTIPDEADMGAVDRSLGYR